MEMEGEEALLSGSSSPIVKLKPKVIARPLSPSHSLSKNPTQTRQGIDRISQEHKIPGLVQALKVYLLIGTAQSVQPHVLARQAAEMILPQAWYSISVWNRCTVVMPVIGFDDGQPERRGILARLSTPKDKIPQFQIILVDPVSEDKEPQDGVHGRLHFNLL